MREIKYFFTIFFVVIISSCGGQEYVRNQDRFEAPIPIDNNPRYYRAAPSYPQNGYAPYPPQYYQQPYQQVPASRFYTNPYAIPPSQNYRAYDSDQYYVPPTNYYGNEPQQNNGRLPDLVK